MILLSLRNRITSWLGFIFIVCLSGCSSIPLPSNVSTSKYLASLPSKNQQAVIVEPIVRSHARVLTLEFKDGHWQQAFSPMRAMVGRRGIAPLNEKREGDGRTPSGTYTLGLAFGYAPSIDTKLAYRQSTQNDFWVDDIHSPQYNQWVVGKPDAASFEEMKRKDDLYRYGVVIEYNTDPIVPGNGSAIFMHIWRAPGKPTSGCVAFSPRSLKHLLAWLDVERDPVILLISDQEKR
jgi:L,D-peptidoglycan transpeptidase YkuD (ErfK/YbiS/YcfS/YnhG family)